jgi:uncharacterized cupin superfamily protein
MTDPFDLGEHPVHLGLGATAVVLPTFDGTAQWYQTYGKNHSEDGVEGRLVAVHSFDSDWSTWEMHPEGAELVYVIAGSMTLIQEVDGVRTEIPMKAGQGAINARGVWHTATVEDSCTALFVTAGYGTVNEVRD